MAKGPWPQALAGLCAAAALACFCLPVSNPDLFWHLCAGRWIAAHHAFPRADWMSWTMAGRRWNDFEWGVQLAWFFVYRVAGLAGLWALKVALLGACACVLWRALGLYGVRAAGRGLGVLAWALAVSPANDVRAENFSLLLFLALWEALEARRLGRGTITPLGLAAFFALWANLHAGFVYGLALAGLFALGDAIERRSWGLGKACAGAAAAALINPYGAGVYAVSLEHWRSLGDLGAHIKEWQGASWTNPWLWPFWLVLVGACAFAFPRKRAPLPHLGALLVFGVSAAAHVRTAAYLVSVAIPILARTLPEARRLFWTALAACAAFFLWKVPPALSARVFDPAFVPTGLADFLDAERATLGRLRLLNPWHWGGYLEHRLYPDYPVFTDGRYLFHPLLKPMEDAKKDPEVYGRWLNGQGVELVLLERTGQGVETPVALKGGRRETLRRPLYLFYLPKERWALVHWDGQGEVFVLRSAVPREWLKAREYLYVRPDDLAAAALKLKEGLASKKEIALEVDRLASDEARRWWKELGAAR